MVKTVRVGPWGGLSEREWTYVPKGDIASISITYTEIIYSIRFYDGEDNTSVFGTEYPGGTNTTFIDDILFNDNVGQLTRISGTIVDNYESEYTAISSLSFSTNKNIQYGPYGSAKGKAFSLQVDKDNFYGFHGRHGMLVDAIGVILRFQTRDEKLELWGGGEGGSLSDYRLDQGPISRIVISHDDIVRSITFLSHNDDPLTTSKKFGSSDGVHDSEINIEEGEKIIGISGTFKKYDALSLVTSLSVETTNRSYGHFGKLMGKPFSSLEKDKPITRFFGSSKTLINGIGVSREHTLPLRVEKWGGPGGTPWTYQTDGAVSYISITYDDDAICGISFASQDQNGKVYYSYDFGGSGGVIKKEINIDVKKERLNGINGTVLRSTGVITSLCFSTDENKSHGPFGVVNGDAFSLPVKDGIISGFHGLESDKLMAIGVFLKPK